jgi:hypothetical protein
MSGGSYDYLCYKMEDAGQRLIAKHQPAYRRAFGELMMKCAKAMHDVEWADSGDKGTGDDEETIMDCIHFSDVLRVAVEDAIETMEELEALIKKAKQE